MISLVSPAKTLNFDPIKNNIKCSLPYFLESSKELVDILRQKSENELSILMKLSKNLSKVNFLRYKNWNLPFNQSNAKAAAFAFEGSVYKGLNISSFSQDEFNGIYDEFIMSLRDKLAFCEANYDKYTAETIKTVHRLANTALQLGFNRFGLALKQVEQNLRQNRANLMRMPQIHCADNYLGKDTINLLQKEIGQTVSK